MQIKVSEAQINLALKQKPSKSSSNRAYASFYMLQAYSDRNSQPKKRIREKHDYKYHRSHMK